MNLELTDVEVGLVWEALTEYAANCSKNERKTQKILAVIERIEKLCGDNT